MRTVESMLIRALENRVLYLEAELAGHAVDADCASPVSLDADQVRRGLDFNVVPMRTTPDDLAEIIGRLNISPEDRKLADELVEQIREERLKWPSADKSPTVENYNDIIAQVELDLDACKDEYGDLWNTVDERLGDVIDALKTERNLWRDLAHHRGQAIILYKEAQLKQQSEQAMTHAEFFTRLEQTLEDRGLGRFRDELIPQAKPKGRVRSPLPGREFKQIDPITALLIVLDTTLIETSTRTS